MSAFNKGTRVSVAYDSEDCRVFAQALDHAWEMFLKTKRLTSRNIDTAKAALAYAILHEASDGQRNPRSLAAAAVARMANHETQVRQQRSWHPPLTNTRSETKQDARVVSESAG